MSENFLDGTGDKPISWWMFEESASPSLDGSTNANNLAWTSGAAARNTTAGQFKQGTSGIKTFAETANLPTLTHASVSSNFPFKGATTAFTVGGWIYVHTFEAS